MVTRLFLCLTLSLVAGQSMAQSSSFMTPPSPPYLAPKRLFSAKLPPGWQPKAFAKRDDFVEFRIISQPGTAFMQIERREVAEGAKARQLLARAKEYRLSKLPHFEEASRRDVVINGLTGAAITGAFWYQGNAQYPRLVEEVFLVIGKEAYVLHFECFEPLGRNVAAELNMFYQSFTPRPPEATPLNNDDEDDDDDGSNMTKALENLPF